eukprot:5206393-Pyramimonas_sp.AAC.1
MMFDRALANNGPLKGTWQRMAHIERERDHTRETLSRADRLGAAHRAQKLAGSQKAAGGGKSIPAREQ